MPGIRRVGAGRQATLNRSKPSAKTPIAAALKYTCCDDPKVEDDSEGHLVCRNCFTQISESNIVADVTFQEDSRGAATVQGGFISENARHARTLGAAAFRRVGGGERNSMQETEANGRRALASLCPRLGIPENVSNQATQLFMLAAQQNFSAGRKTDEVAAACLYAACRRQSENTTLLIDIAELLRINVFRLGDVYKTLCKDLYLDGGEKMVGQQTLIDVEYLIMKYCTKLEFGDKVRTVANDAAKIVRRMKRDWIVTGRHPAGLCASCIILAARMNNFRRTTRELVYVAKVSSMTIGKRVHEFKQTKSAALTVEQFREYGFRYGKAHDPPSLEQSALNKEKFEQKKRKRQEASMSRDSSVLSSGVCDTPAPDDSAADNTPAPDEDAERVKRQRTESGESAVSARPHESLRYDADGFAIPALPLSVMQENRPEKRKRGRPRKVPIEPVIITEEDLEEEKALEAEINQVLSDETINMSRDEVQQAKDEENAKRIADEQKDLAAQQTMQRRAAEGITWLHGKVPEDHAEVTAEDLEAEFANDPEVINCELSAAEKVMKEQIWVLHNEDWLRQQQEKQMMEEVIKAAGTVPRGRKTKVTRRKKKGKFGDITDANTPIETPADANMAMLAKRAPAAFSKHINYEALARAYQISPATSTTASRAGSEAATSRARSPSTTSSIDERASANPTSRTQHVTFDTTASARLDRQNGQGPLTPPKTQELKANDGEDEEQNVGNNLADYDDSEVDVVSDDGGQHWHSDSDDHGEDDYQRTLNPFSGAHLSSMMDDGEDEY